MKRNRLVALLVTAALSVSLLAGCGSSSSSSSDSSSDTDTEEAAEEETGEETEEAEEAEEESSSVVSGTDDFTAAVAAETQADAVTVAVDDDSFTIGPWGSEGSVRDWTENILWAHLAYRPYIGATLDDGLQLVAAKTVTQVDDTTYEIEIYDNIIDSEGNAITASDVVYSYEKLKEYGYSTDIGNYYDSAEATGDYTLTMNMKSSADGVIEKLLTAASIASEEWYENASENDINSDPATTGAYTVTAMVAGSSVSMEARDDYWKTEDLADSELQNVKEINIRCITEASSRSIALENGEVDMAEISSTDVSRFEGDDNYNVTDYMNAMSQYLVFNTSENSVCQDVNVRLAIAYAFDAYTVLLGSGSDAGVMSYDVAPNLAPDYVDEWDSEDYYAMDLEMSAYYLDLAGYEPGELEVHFMCSSQAPQGPYEAMQALLEQAGITMVIDAYDRALRSTYDSDPTMWDFKENSDTVDDFTVNFWNALFNDENFALGTEGFTQDDTLQELLDAANEDRSEENMNAFHDYVVENCYMIGLYTEIRSIVTQSGITDIALECLNPTLNAMTFTSDYTTSVQ